MTNLPQSDSELWNAYLETENLYLRSERNAALDRFLDSFTQLPDSTQYEWALQFVADPTLQNFKMRMPLFRRALLPHIAVAVENRVAGCARWLSKHAILVFKCREIVNDLSGDFTEQGLLLTALDQDASDDESRVRLVDLMSSHMEYTLHELPWGVLYGHDCATPSQCGEMLNELDDFIAHTDRLGCTSDYAELVSACHFHYDNYARYLADHAGASTYEEYISQLDN